MNEACAFFKKEVEEIFKSMTETIYYVHPTAKMIKKNNIETFDIISCEHILKEVIDVYSLTDLLKGKDKTKDHHFIAVNISSTDQTS